MHPDHRLSRRRLLRHLLLGAPLAALFTRAARAAEAPLVAPDSPEAKALAYVSDARSSKEAAAGNHCGDCALYQGPSGSTRGPCQIFAGKDVQSAGWCRSWAPQM